MVRRPGDEPGNTAIRRTVPANAGSARFSPVTVFVGAIVIGDLRLLGGVPSVSRPASIARSAQRILLWAGLAVLVTGIPQFTTNALHVPQVLAVRLEDVGPRRRAPLHSNGASARGGRRRGTPVAVVPRVVGAVSFALWMSVAISGR